jgi:hypothetical protein
MRAQKLQRLWKSLRPDQREETSDGIQLICFTFNGVKISRPMNGLSDREVSIRLEEPEKTRCVKAYSMLPTIGELPSPVRADVIYWKAKVFTALNRESRFNEGFSWAMHLASFVSILGQVPEQAGYLDAA